METRQERSEKRAAALAWWEKLGEEERERRKEELMVWPTDPRQQENLIVDLYGES